MNKLLKILRFIKIYGPVRTWFKLAGRARIRLGLLRPRQMRNGVNVGVIGCGQFAFSTIGYSLSRYYSTPFIDCFDIDSSAQISFANFYRIAQPSSSALEVIQNDRVRYLYIASNHASHSDYATQGLEAGKTVYIEKPIAVTKLQLKSLVRAVDRYDGKIYSGYNRPFSLAVRRLKNYVRDMAGPITLNCFISGHHIPPEHWYRDPLEGTRVCGNVGHWLDLAVHILEWRSLPDQWKIQLNYSNELARDDDFSISMVSCEGDLVVIVLTARSEPFEGINETINFQQGDTICKIDDFRTMMVWQNKKVDRYRFWPKDVGHIHALRQPFEGNSHREWSEVVKSTLLMLCITDMVKSGKESISFSFTDALKDLEDPEQPKVPG